MLLKRSTSTKISACVCGPARTPERLIQPLHQQPPVRQAGEAVVAGVLVQLVLEGLALGDVAEGDHRAGRRASLTTADAV